MNIVPPAAEKIVSIHLIPSCHSGLVPELYWSTVMNNAGALHIACHSRYGKGHWAESVSCSDIAGNPATLSERS